jgi:hypothetical protein
MIELADPVESPELLAVSATPSTIEIGMVSSHLHSRRHV